MTPGWISDARNIGVRAVLGGLDIQAGRGQSFGPCPSCGAVHRSSSDRRGACGIRSHSGFCCYKCGLHGDVVDLAGFCMFNSRYSELEYDQKLSVKKFLTEGVKVDPEELRQARRRTVQLEPHDVRAMWAEWSNAPTEQVVEWGRSRGLNIKRLMELGVMRRPTSGSSWWKPGRNSLWGLVTIGYNKYGQPVNIHGRLTVDDEKWMKTIWGSAPSAGLAFLNNEAIQMMRGADFDTAFVAEGVTDFWSACQVSHGIPVVGFAAGGESYIHEFTGSVKNIIVATDEDSAGDRYLDKIVESYPADVNIGVMRT